MKLSLLRCSVILVVFLAGCPHDCYEVEVRPAGRTFHRKLTCWHASGQEQEVQPLSAEQLAQIGRLYPKQAAPTAPRNRSSRASSATRLPPTWAGRVTTPTLPRRWQPGVLCRTLSRQRRFGSELSHRRQAADQLADVVVGWLTAESGTRPNFPG